MNNINSIMSFHSCSVHDAVNELLEHCRKLVRAGIPSDYMPETITITEFALLGDLDRDRLMESMKKQWSMLQERGLVFGTVGSASSPFLRLLAHILSLEESIKNAADIKNHPERTKFALDAPSEIFRCPTHVQGSWGQCAKIHFSGQDILYLLIAPDPDFCLHPSLVTVGSVSKFEGSFPFLINNGRITFLLIQHGGELFRHVVHIITKDFDNAPFIMI